MKVGLLRKTNKIGEHNKYRHLIFYTENKDRTLSIRFAIPLFII